MVKVGYNVSYNIEDMKAMNEKFKTAFHALEELCEKGASKVGIHDDKLYVSWSWWLVQGVHRYYYGENRVKITEFIKNTFTEYFIFFDMIMSCIKHEPRTVQSKEAEKLKEENITLISKWNKGLVLLRGQYTNDTTICAILDGISSKLSELAVS
jgi:hypothetical protein